MAIKDAQVCGATIAGVDILIDRQNQPHVLEVNAVPGWKHLAQITGLDVTCEILSFICSSAKEKATHAQPR